MKKKRQLIKKCDHKLKNGKSAWIVEKGYMFGDEFHCTKCGKIEFDF